MSEQAASDKLEYTATLGIIAMEGRGFEYPTDMVAASNGRLYVANRSRDFGERGVRVTVLDLDSEYYGTFGHFGSAAKPGTLAMAASIAGVDGDNAPPETLVDRCLAQMGAPNGGLPRIPERTASVSDAPQSRNHTTTTIIPITLTTREQAP